jgi:ribosomal protein S18 acetylase RimI-like enzyme
MVGREWAQVEQAAVAAWPAGRTQVEAGWLLRHTPGVGRRRSNSALPLDREPEPSLDAVEAFYQDLGLPVIVQVSPAEEQGALDAALAARGYRREAPTLVLTAPTTAVAHLVNHGWPVVIEGVASGRWLRAYQALNGPADTSAVAERVLSRVPSPAAFARVDVDGEDAAIGLFVADGRWAGVFCMATAARFRRRGLALAVLVAGARWAAAAGCAGMYLQVEQDNVAARDLYARIGFRHSHSYHYRVADIAES